MIIPSYQKSSQYPKSQWNKVVTTKYLVKFQSPRAITQPKIIRPEQNVNLICNLSLYTHIPNIKSISQSIAEKSGDHCFISELQKDGHGQHYMSRPLTCISAFRGPGLNVLQFYLCAFVFCALLLYMIWCYVVLCIYLYSRFKSTLGLVLICCLCIYIPTLNKIYLLTYLLTSGWDIIKNKL